MQPAPASNVALAEPASWAASLGNQLKYLQSTLTGETPENRQAYLEDEMRRALQAVPAAKRGAYLDALTTSFPAWEMAALPVVTPLIAAKKSPEEIVTAFLQIVPQLSGEQREKVKEQLAALGLVTPTKQPLEGDALTDVQAKLKLSPGDPIDSQRLGKIFAIFAETMLTLDQLAWNVWRSAAPKSAIRRDTSVGDLRQLTRRSLAGEAEASPAVVQKQIEATRQLIAGLLAGLGPAGKNFARRYQQRYSPDAVRETVRAEGGGGDARYWKKYHDLAGEISEAVIENDVQEAVVKYAEDLMRGPAR